MTGEHPLRERILALAAESIRRRTTADRPDELAACLELFCAATAGWPVTVERLECDGVPSAILRPVGVDTPRVLLCGHLDVVPAEDYQFVPRLEHNRLYGRGALDMKGSLAAITTLFAATAAEQIPWWLLIVTDEETGGERGAGHLAAGHPPGELFVAVEPSDLALSVQSKGALRLRLTVRGRRAHASTPWLGESAVEKMMEIAPGIRQVIPELLEEAWQTTACLSIVAGGSVINQVPDECSLSLDIRYVPGDDPERIKAAFRERLPGVEITVLSHFPPMVCREDAPLVAGLREVYRQVTGKEPALGREHGATDARYFSDFMDALIFGPTGADLHGPHEWVDVPSLMTTVAVLETWGRSLK